MTGEVTTGADGVTVRKAFDADSFPVPAITFEIDSSRSDAVEFTLVDSVPETFPMDHVGFHPDYDSDRWTAYQDHRVQYERTLDAGESVTTVYGIRIEEPDEVEAFLGEPSVDVRALGEPAGPDVGGVEADTTDVVPPESTDVVREAIAGDRPTVPGLDDPSAGVDDDDQNSDSKDADDEADVSDESDGPSLPKYDPIGGDAEADAGPAEAEPADESPLDGSPVPADEEDVSDEDDVEGEEDESDDVPTDSPAPVEDEDGTTVVGGEDGGPIPYADEAPTPTGGDVSAPDGDDGDENEEEDDEDTTGVGHVESAAGGLVESLAAEIRAGDVSPEDLAVVGDALSDVTPSTEARIDHLQARVSDLEAYADALEAFIDENGSAQQVLDELAAGVDDLSDRTDGLEAELESAAAERGRFREELEELADAADDLDELEDDLEDLDDDLEDLEDDLAAAESRLAEVAEETKDVAELRESVAGLRDDIADVGDDVAALENWREQLTSVLGG